MRRTKTPSKELRRNAWKWQPNSHGIRVAHSIRVQCIRPRRACCWPFEHVTRMGPTGSGSNPVHCLPFSIFFLNGNSKNIQKYVSPIGNFNNDIYRDCRSRAPIGFRVACSATYLYVVSKRTCQRATYACFTQLQLCTCTCSLRANGANAHKFRPLEARRGMASSHPARTTNIEY